jgi:hypothetical protein
MVLLGDAGHDLLEPAPRVPDVRILDELPVLLVGADGNKLQARRAHQLFEMPAGRNRDAVPARRQLAAEADEREIVAGRADRGEEEVHGLARSLTSIRGKDRGKPS